ncbi:MAG: hypothetical protein ABI641_15865 [Caldimonas sp.]
MNGRACRTTTLVVAAVIAGAGAAAADGPPIDAAALPQATRRVPASPEECIVWRREASFAASVAAHDATEFAAHLHPGAVFNAGTAEADRGSAAVAAGWSAIVDGRAVALRWRPGIVQIAGDPRIAVSRGPYIVQRARGEGRGSFNVGLYQTVWLRDTAGGTWRVLFDGSASTPVPFDDRAAADRWVAAQPASDCAAP